MSDLTRKICRFVLAAVFIYAAVAKVRAGIIKDNTIYGHSPAWVQVFLPFGEIALAGWLVWGFLPQYAALTSIAILSLFSGAIGAELRSPTPKPCGCMGPTAVATQLNNDAAIRRDLWFAIGRNGLLMAGGVWLLLSSKRSPNAAILQPLNEPIPSTT